MSVDISGVDLAEQRVIVIGSGHGMGRTIAELLTEAGAMVRLVVQTEAERDSFVDLIDDTEARFDVIVANTTNRIAIERTVQNLKDQSGFITLIVNVVEFTAKAIPLWQVDPGEWSSSLEASLRNSLLWTRAAVTEMSENGRIINIADASLVSRLMNNLAAEAQARKIEIISIDPASKNWRYIWHRDS